MPGGGLRAVMLLLHILLTATADP